MNAAVANGAAVSIDLNQGIDFTSFRSFETGISQRQERKPSMTQECARSTAESLGFRQLRLLESVGRLKSVRRGSEECNLSQPAVTQALSKLESLAGHTLLERRACGSYLTEAGEIFHKRIVRMFDQLVEALLELDVPGGRTGATTISHRLTRSQVRSLLAIIEQGSFSKAAVGLNITTASLQRAVRDLENNLRKPIFYRSAAGFLVTPEGIEFGRRLRLALQEVEWAVQEMDSLQGAGECRIVIGALPFGGSVLLAAILDEFINRHPQVDICIVNVGASEMISRLRSGEVDIVLGLIQGETGNELDSQKLVDTPYKVVARRGHPLTRKGALTLDDLVRQDWVIGTIGSNRRACFDALFAGGPSPKAQIATCSLTVLRNLISGSDRLTLVTSYELLHESMLVSLPVHLSLPAPAIGITTRANWQPTALHADFMRLVRERVQIAVSAPGLRQVV